MKKITNIMLLIFTSFVLSGCATALLFTGTVIGGGYAIQDINENYNGDGAEYIKDKTGKVYDVITDN